MGLPNRFLQLRQYFRQPGRTVFQRQMAQVFYVPFRPLYRGISYSSEEKTGSQRKRYHVFDHLFMDADIPHDAASANLVPFRRERGL